MKNWIPKAASRTPTARPHPTGIMSWNESQVFDLTEIKGHQPLAVCLYPDDASSILFVISTTFFLSCRMITRDVLHLMNKKWYSSAYACNDIDKFALCAIKFNCRDFGLL